MRLLNLTGLCFATASALLLYSLSYETRRIEALVQAQERAADNARSDIAVLKAERSHLSRPDRIDTLARQQGLMPPRPDQLAAPGLTAPSAVSALPEMRRLAEGE